MALSRSELFLAVVEKASCFAAEDEDNLAVGLVLVIADGATHLEPSTHNLVLPVVESAEQCVALATLELRIGDFFYLIEIYYHI